MNVNILFNANPDKLARACVGKTYREFEAYLKSLDNFKIVEYMSIDDFTKLYNMSKQRAKEMGIEE